MKPIKAARLMGQGGGPPTDPYWANVASLLHFNGSSGSTTFTDEKGKTWTANGTAEIDNASPVAFNGYYTGDGGGYISTTAHTDFNFGTGAWTVEFRVRLTAATAQFGHILANGTAAWGSNARGIALRGNSASAPQQRRIAVVAFGPSDGDILRSTTQLTVGVAYAVAVTKSGTTYRIYINGALDASTTGSFSHDFSNNGTRIGASGWDGAAGQIVADIDEFRATKGVARYTGSSYSVSGSEFPNS